MPFLSILIGGGVVWHSSAGESLTPVGVTRYFITVRLEPTLCDVITIYRVCTNIC